MRLLQPWLDHSRSGWSQLAYVGNSCFCSTYLIMCHGVLVESVLYVLPDMFVSVLHGASVQGRSSSTFPYCEIRCEVVTQKKAWFISQLKNILEELMNLNWWSYHPVGMGKAARPLTLGRWLDGCVLFQPYWLSSEMHLNQTEYHCVIQACSTGSFFRQCVLH